MTWLNYITKTSQNKHRGTIHKKYKWIHSEVTITSTFPLTLCVLTIIHCHSPHSSKYLTMCDWVTALSFTRGQMICTSTIFPIPTTSNMNSVLLILHARPLVQSSHGSKSKDPLPVDIKPSPKPAVDLTFHCPNVIHAFVACLGMHHSSPIWWSGTFQTNCVSHRDIRGPSTWCRHASHLSSH